MENAPAIKVKGVEEGTPAWVTLLHTVVDIKYRSSGYSALLSVPVECLQVSRKKRVNGKWVILFLLSLVGVPLVGFAVILLMFDALQWVANPNMFILLSAILFLLPSVFFFFRIWMREPVIVFTIKEANEEKGMRFQFWLPLKQPQRDDVEALLASIEAVRPETISLHDCRPVQETDMLKSWLPHGRGARLWCVFFMLWAPGIIVKLGWIGAFVLVAVLLSWVLMSDVFGLRKPALLRNASRAMRRGEWEEALRGLSCFEEQDADRKGCCLLDRLYCMRRLGRFDDAYALLDAQKTVIDAGIYHGVHAQLLVTQRVTQRKNGFIGGRWFPGAMKGNT